MKRELIKMANHLDRLGMRKEADYLDRIIKKVATDEEREIPRGGLLGMIFTKEFMRYLKEEGMLPSEMQELSDEEFEEEISGLSSTED